MTILLTRHCYKKHCSVPVRSCYLRYPQYPQLHPLHHSSDRRLMEKHAASIEKSRLCQFIQQFPGIIYVFQHNVIANVKPICSHYASSSIHYTRYQKAVATSRLWLPYLVPVSSCTLGVCVWFHSELKM